MAQGIYKRTKAHRKAFKDRMHTPEIAKKRWKTRRENEKRAEKERQECSVKDNKFDGFDDRIENLGKDELEDKLASIRMEILSSVKRLGVEYKRLMNLQDERDKIEIRLEELGMKF